MKTKISKEWLEEKGACSGGREWFAAQKETDAIKVIKELAKEKKYQWANWTLTKFMTKPQCVEYAIFAAEQVIKIFEDKHPDDKRPRNAIEAAKKYLKDPTEENRRSAAYAAYAAAAADAAYAHAAYAAAYAAADAAYAAAAAAAAAKEKMQAKILKHGLKILGRHKMKYKILQSIRDIYDRLKEVQK